MFSSYNKIDTAFNAMVDSLEEMYEVTTSHLKKINAKKKSRVLQVYSGVAILLAGYNLWPVQATEVRATTTTVHPVATPAPKPSTVSDGYLYPHIRVERGVPVPHRIDYGTQDYINQVVGGSFGRYLTIKTPGGRVGDANFIRTLDQMYVRKYEQHGKNVAAEILRQSTYETYNTSRTKMTLGQYLRGFNQIIDESVSAIDFSALCRDKWLALDQVRCTALREIVGRVDARMMVSYQMTEMFDKTTPGETNAWVLDQMYRYQGREAVDAIPSMSGGIPVVGGFQITEQLIGRDGVHPRVITLVSDHSRLQIPESIGGLKGVLHERAAFYSVVYNLGRLLKVVDADGVRILREAAVTKKSDMVAFLAAAHRGSGDARDFAVRWLYDGISNPIEVYMYTVNGRNYPEYASTARKNYAGLNIYVAKTFETNKI